MYAPVSLKEAIQKTSLIYHRTIELIYEKHLLAGEVVLFVSECTYHLKNWDDTFNKWRGSSCASVLIITNKRWIRKPQDWFSKQGPRILEYKDSVGRLLQSTDKLKFYWDYPSPKLPDNKYWKRYKLTLDEWAVEDLRILPLGDMVVWGTKNMSIKENGVFRDLLWIRFNNDRQAASLDLEVGEEFHKLLQLSATNRANDGVIEVAGVQAEEQNKSPYALVERLGALKEMLDQDLITNEEYQQKKEKIIRGL